MLHKLSAMLEIVSHDAVILVTRQLFEFHELVRPFTS